MASRGDPRATVNVDTDVALLTEVRLASVDADADANRPGVECELRCLGGSDSIARLSEGDKEGVPLGVDSRVPSAPLSALLRH